MITKSVNVLQHRLINNLEEKLATDGEKLNA
ncbi:MAG: hypothetical protein HUJ51_03165 [Eggerthellaceae bacterium]|nr:hypothetical protein [Eggerthellaceae bacterium]